MRSFYIAGPLIVKGAIGIFPFFIGCAFMGLCVFSDSYRFSTFDLSMFTLYAMMNGDMIWDTYHDLSYYSLFFSCIYLYCFIFFAISVIQNSFLIAVEDGYLSSKFNKRYDWITKQSIDPSKQAGHEGEDTDMVRHNFLEIPIASENMMVAEYIQARKVLVQERRERSKEILKFILDEEEKLWDMSKAKN